MGSLGVVFKTLNNFLLPLVEVLFDNKRFRANWYITDSDSNTIVSIPDGISGDAPLTLHRYATIFWAESPPSNPLKLLNRWC